MGDADKRLEQLPLLAELTERYGRPLLEGDWSLVESVHNVVRVRYEEQSEEGRRKRRWLP